MRYQRWGQRQRQLAIRVSLFNSKLGLHLFLFCLYFLYSDQFLPFFFFFTFYILHSISDRSCLTRGQTHAPWIGKAGPKPQDHQGTPSCSFFWLVHSFLCFFIPSLRPQAFVPLCFLSLFFLWASVYIFLIPDMLTRWVHSIFKMAMGSFHRQTYAFHKTIMRWDLEAHPKTWYIPLVWIPESTL